MEFAWAIKHSPISFLLILDISFILARVCGAWSAFGDLVRSLESLEGRLKGAICESLEGRLKVAIGFNHHWGAKEVGSNLILAFFPYKLVYFVA